MIRKALAYKHRNESKEEKVRGVYLRLNTAFRTREKTEEGTIRKIRRRMERLHNLDDNEQGLIERITIASNEGLMPVALLEHFSITLRLACEEFGISLEEDNEALRTLADMITRGSGNEQEMDNQGGDSENERENDGQDRDDEDEQEIGGAKASAVYTSLSGMLRNQRRRMREMEKIVKDFEDTFRHPTIEKMSVFLPEANMLGANLIRERFRERCILCCGVVIGGLAVFGVYKWGEHNGAEQVTKPNTEEVQRLQGALQTSERKKGQLQRELESIRQQIEDGEREPLVITIEDPNGASADSGIAHGGGGASASKAEQVDPKAVEEALRGYNVVVELNEYVDGHGEYAGTSKALEIKNAVGERVQHLGWTAYVTYQKRGSKTYGVLTLKKDEEDPKVWRSTKSVSAR